MALRTQVRRAALVSLSLAFCASGCGITGVDPSPMTTSPVGLPPEQPVTPLTWRRCDGDFECANLEAPLDYSRPADGTIELALVRRPASTPARRSGALFMNPGGPGGSAIKFVEQIAGKLPSRLRRQFDIVGIDPRGVGRSTRLDCEQDVPAMYRADPTIEDAADRQALISTSRRFVDDCEAAAPRLLPHLGTSEVARDMDLARRAMGDAQLSYYGFSYGTAIGQVYAELFPRRVRAMVLDGVVDLAASGIQGARVQADGFERSLAAFARSCSAATACPLGEHPIATVDRVSAAAEEQPIPAPEADRRAGPAEVTLALVQAMYDSGSWDRLTRALAEADDDPPDASRLVGLADAYLNRARFAPYFAVSCLDSEWPGVDALFAAAKRAGRSAPHFGEAVTNDYVRCSLWPAKSEPLSAPDRTSVGKLAPLVVVSTTGDPATPYEAGVELARRLPRSALITNVGDGHTGSLKGDRCIDEPIFEYLEDLKLPDRRLRCS